MHELRNRERQREGRASTYVLIERFDEMRDPAALVGRRDCLEERKRKRRNVR
jgi:hypothetical protein